MTKKTTKPAETMASTTGAPEVPERASMFDPLTRMSLSEWFDRWPDLFARRWPETFQGVPFVEASFRMEQFTDDDGTIVIRSELPGLDPDEDVTITLDGDRLTIAAQREERTSEKDEGTYHSEFHYGSFKRAVTLPVGAVTDDVSATYIDGILEVRVPVDPERSDITTVPITKGN